MIVKFKNRAELNAAIASGAYQGKAMHLLILHDDACTPHQCSCEPEFVFQELTVDAYIEGQRMQANWVRSKLS